jgi:hypothetical protein
VVVLVAAAVQDHPWVAAHWVAEDQWAAAVVMVAAEITAAAVQAPAAAAQEEDNAFFIIIKLSPLANAGGFFLVSLYYAIRTYHHRTLYRS